MKNIELAENIISEVMADEEMRLRNAMQSGYFYSGHLLNKCRKFFNLSTIESLDKSKCKDYVAQQNDIVESQDST